MNTYRIFPVLWNQNPSTQAMTVYGIDRSAPSIPSSCSARVKEDPAYSWSGSSFQRILPQTNNGLNAVTWQELPAWISFAQANGYTLNTDLSKLKPYSDIYITGP
jgi:hypothetical protein